MLILEHKQQENHVTEQKGFIAVNKKGYYYSFCLSKVKVGSWLQTKTM